MGQLRDSRIERLEHTLAKASGMCKSSGVKLTEKRQQVLTVLLQADAPLSAYEVVEHYRGETGQSITPMSVYRMLDFLVGENLAHKLSSVNKFVACSHIACDHKHRVPQFLICQVCQRVSEISVEKELIDQLQSTVSQAGFTMLNSQMELDCVCNGCQD